MKRSVLKKREGIQQTLERYKRFDYDYIPFGHNWSIPDGEYQYEQNAFHRAVTGLVCGILSVTGPVYIRIGYGARVVGKEHLKPLKGKGAISVCNHFSYLDTLFIRQATGHFRTYHTIAPWNNKTGIGGAFLRHGKLLPLSPNLSATRNLWRRMDKLFKEGKIVNFYAEQAMWIAYQKPRPMKEGAFFYAVKFDVPVLPVFCTFRKTKRGMIRKLRIHICPAVYPDRALPREERIAKMKKEAEAAWKEVYERAYGIPLQYLSREEKTEEAAEECAEEARA